MSKSMLVGVTWFIMTDKYHRETSVHCIEDGHTRSVCGKQDITEVNKESMLKFATIDNIPLKDFCKNCLRSVL